MKKEMSIWAVMLFSALFLPLMSEAFDHSQSVKGPFKSGEDVTRACLQCHDKQEEDVMKTPHWKWKGVPRTVKGDPMRAGGRGF